MRRTPALLLATALTLAACGGSDDGDDDAGDTGAPAEADADTDAETDGDTGAEPAADDAATDDESGEDAADDTTDDATPADEPTGSDKPEVDFPGEAPDALVVNVLVDGTGEPAEVGDSVIVDYVGVRSLDGVEFDNSYDRGQPFPVVLGSGGVIAGWEEGLDGARAGDRIQLDIPSDLAYGEAARSDIIRENEPLTFVIDVRAVVRAADPADAPDDPGVPVSEGVTETEFTDLEEGDGPTIAEGDTIVFHFVYFRGDNGVLLESSWGGSPVTITYAEDQLIPGLVDGMEGMQVGGRRSIVVPPEDAFGVEGNPQGGLPAETDVIFVIDLLAAY